MIDMNEVLFSRLLRKEKRTGNTEDLEPAVSIVVTKENNGYAVWYVNGVDPRLIAWTKWRDSAIRYAVVVDAENAGFMAEEGRVNLTLSEPWVIDVAAVRNAL